MLEAILAALVFAVIGFVIALTRTPEKRRGGYIGNRWRR